MRDEVDWWAEQLRWSRSRLVRWCVWFGLRALYQHRYPERPLPRRYLEHFADPTLAEPE